MMQPALIILGVALRIQIAPDVACPSAKEVEEALAGLLPQAELGEKDPVFAKLSREGESLVVQVMNGHGWLLSERRIPALVPGKGQCPEHAAEVAVIVAAATATLRGPVAVGPLIEPPLGQLEPPVATRDPPLVPPLAPPDPPVAPPGPPVPPPELSAAPPKPSDIPPKAPILSPDPLVLRVPAASRVRGASEKPINGAPHVELSFNLGASLAGGTTAPTGGVGISLLARQWLGLGLSALYVGDHGQPIGSGEAHWSRFGLAAALTCRSSLIRALSVEAGAAFVAAMRVIEGRSYPESVRSSIFDPGLAFTLRLGATGNRNGLWAGPTLAWWPRPQGVYVQGGSGRGDLPSLELTLGLGVTFGLAVTSARDPT